MKGNLKISITQSLLLVDRLSIDVDFTAIVIMESMGIISFLVAFLFFRQCQRISGKQKTFLNALNRQMISERGDGKCFSSEWVMDNIVYKPKRILNATPLLMATITLLLAIFYFLIGPHIFANIIGFGYASVVALVGIATLLGTDAFEAYGYTSAIHEVSIEQLDREDQSYIELAREAVEKAFLRFASLGIAFAVFGPFIPQIFNGVVEIFVFYTAVFFQASEVLFKVLSVLGAFIVLLLPVVMLLLPEFLGRILIRKGKSLTRKMFKRRVEK